MMDDKNIFRLQKNSCIRSWQEISPDLEGEAVKDFSEEAYKDAEVIWQTRHKYVKKLDIPFSPEPLTIIFKHYCERRFWRYLFRPSLAWREALGFCIAESFGIPTAKILSCGENRDFLHLFDSWIITKFLPFTQDGGIFMKDTSQDPELHGEKLSFCKQNLEYIARLHKAGYVHGGSHPRNFLFQKKPGEKGIKVVWIDLATIKKRKFRLAKHLHDDLRHLLAPMQFTLEEITTLIEFYRQHNPAFSPDPATLHIKIN